MAKPCWSASREIAYKLYQQIIALRLNGPRKWSPQMGGADRTGAKEILPMARLKMVMTRGKDDPKELWDLLGSKDYRKELDRQYKNRKSNFKIALVVDMWLTGFDVPHDTIYIDKPISATT